MKKFHTPDSRSQTLVFLFFLFITHYSSLITFSYAADVGDIIERIQKKYREIHDIQGAFLQTSYIKDLERTEKYTGRFFIKKPSQMRWGYTKPRDEEVIIRGNDIWIYKKSAKQLLRSKFSKDAYSQVPIALLESIGDLKTDYDIKILTNNTLELIPKQQMSFIKKLHLKTTSGDFPIKEFTIFDVYGNNTIIELKELKINTGLDESLFVFEAPPGIEIFDFNQ